MSAKVLAISVLQSSNTSSSTAATVPSPSASDTNFCLEHQVAGHHLSKCKRFSHHPIAERQGLVKNNMLCFGCLLAGHRSKDCKNRLLCDKCGGKHPSVMHTVLTF